MTPTDLKWVRENAGLTQKQAADVLGVDRRTFSRWETGAVTMSTRKWSRFLEAVKITPEAIPKQTKYDSRGYPEGFTPDAEGDYDADEKALEAIEGAEYDARARERYRLNMVRLTMSPAQIEAELRAYDLEVEALKLAG